jgi:hypothetical protein
MINLIPLSYLNEACFLSLNVDAKKYQMLLKITQDNLKQLLGAEFYLEIETQYDGNTLSEDNDALYDPYLKDYIAWRAYSEYIGFSNADETPTGTRKFKDENSDLLSDVEMYARQRNIVSKVTFYRGEMINFIKQAKENYPTKYPLYTERCIEEFSFGITSVDKRSNALFKVNKTITNNE